MKEQQIDLQTAELAWSKGFKKRNNINQGLLQKWLREVHNIDIFVIPNFTPNYNYCNFDRNIIGHNLNERIFDVYEFTIFINRKSNYKSKFYDTYEEALEFGLQKSFNLII
jgi:hypothetical protein